MGNSLSFKVKVATRTAIDTQRGIITCCSCKDLYRYHRARRRCGAAAAAAAAKQKQQQQPQQQQQQQQQQHQQQLVVAVSNEFNVEAGFYAENQRKKSMHLLVAVIVLGHVL